MTSGYYSIHHSTPIVARIGIRAALVDKNRLQSTRLNKLLFDYRVDLSGNFMDLSRLLGMENN